MKLAQMYMKRVTRELELVHNSDRESTQEALLLQGLHFAYRAHQVILEAVVFFNYHYKMRLSVFNRLMVWQGKKRKKKVLRWHQEISCYNLEPIYCMYCQRIVFLGFCAISYRDNYLCFPSPRPILWLGSICKMTRIIQVSLFSSSLPSHFGELQNSLQCLARTKFRISNQNTLKINKIKII